VLLSEHVVSKLDFYHMKTGSSFHLISKESWGKELDGRFAAPCESNYSSLTHGASRVLRHPYFSLIHLTFQIIRLSPWMSLRSSFSYSVSWCVDFFFYLMFVRLFESKELYLSSILGNSQTFWVSLSLFILSFLCGFWNFC
jgi:hypothetical protein